MADHVSRHAGAEDDPLARLLDEVVDLSVLSASWISIIEGLLSFCVTNPPAPMSWAVTASETVDLRDGVQVRISGAVESALGDVLERDSMLAMAPVRAREALRSAVLESAAEIGAHVATDLAEALAAHAAARALDELVGEGVTEWFRAHHEVKIQPGTLYPRPTHDPRRVGMGRATSLNSRPSSLPARELDRTQSLALGRRAPGYSVVLDFRGWERSQSLVADGRIVAAAGQTGLTLDEYDVGLDDPSVGVFTNRGPSDEEGAFEHALSQVLDAVARGVNVFLLPEYALTDTAHRRLVDALTARLSEPLLLVAGVSAGLTERGQVINESRMRVAEDDVDVRAAQPARRRDTGAECAGVRAPDLGRHVRNGVDTVRSRRCHSWVVPRPDRWAGGGDLHRPAR